MSAHLVTIAFLPFPGRRVPFAVFLFAVSPALGLS